MTGLLSDLMHDRADTLAAPELDLDALMRDGQRRVVRRRTAFVGGGAALAVVAVVAGLTAPGLLFTDSDSTAG
ncbi:hypothetical protein [Nocardioides sp. InS609-2]|uniref:hypothetical protein n=1 Tax=Nocardioides sp. InS609-2 TaxID=2760705 RepID=UPI0020BD79A6|nr:hypothetical protein [Nocardioides sp. InS609-2]